VTVQDLADKLREFDPGMECVDSKGNPLSIDKTTSFHSDPGEIPKVIFKTGSVYTPYVYNRAPDNHEGEGFQAGKRRTWFMD
jgi:hypothetical protein